MDPEIRKFVLLNPSMLKAFGFHGLELAAYAFEIQAYQKGYVCIEAVKRDKSGHFFKDDGAPCPHRKGGKTSEIRKSEIKLSEIEQWDNWGKGRNAVDKVLSGTSVPKAMKRINGEDINFIYDPSAKFGFTHIESKSEIRDKDKICETIAFGSDEELTPRGKLIIRYNGFIVVLNSNEADGSRNFITGYQEDDIYETQRRKKRSR